MAKNSNIPRRFEVKNAADTQGKKTFDVYLYDSVGEWFGGVSAKTFIDAVNTGATGAEVLNLFINSPGGDCFEADAIYNFLCRFKGFIIVHIDGLAASAAATIAMAGDERHIAENAMMMIHNSWTQSTGSKGDIRKVADTLEKLDATIAGTYAAATGKPLEQITAWMDAETWFSAAESMDHGFATSINQSKRAAALALPASSLEKFTFSNQEKFAALTVSADNLTQPGDIPPANNGKDSPMKDAPKSPDGNTPPANQTTPANPPEAPGKKFLDAFGPEGGVWFAEGKSYEQAQNLYTVGLKTANTALTEENADLKKKLAAANAAAGSTQTSAFDGKDGDSKDSEELANLTNAFGGDVERAKRVLVERAKNKK